MSARQLLRGAAALLCVCLASGCFRARDAVVQEEAVSFLKFSGATDGAKLTLERDGKREYDGREIDPDTLYRATPGTSVVIVVKDGVEVVRRRLFLAGGQTSEVIVP